MKKSLFFVLALMSVSLLACKKPEVQVPEPVAPEVKLEPVISKATATNFENGDQIGLSIIRSDGSLYAENESLTYSESIFSSSLKWYAEGGESCSISAYYPYVEGGVPTSFSVSEDQSAGASSSDLMFAFKENVFPQSEPVLTVFKHQLVQLIITVDNKAGAKVEDILVKGVLPKVNVVKADNGSLSIASDSEAAAVNIKAECLEDGKKYRVIFAPQKNSFEVALGVEGSVLRTGVDEVELRSGYTYSLGIEILPDMVKASFSGEIEAWEDGGVLGGNIVDESVAKEFEDYFVYHDKSYKTVLLNGKKWMAEPLAYLPEGLSASSDPTSGSVWYPYSSDGTTVTPLTDEASVKAYGYLYSYSAALGEEITTDNYRNFENAQGICPKGWHIPNRAEYLSLFGYSNKNVGESAAVTDPSALFWDAERNYAYIAKANEAGFNFVQSGAVANAKYQQLICSASNCSVEEYYGKIAMTNLMCSTPYNVSTSSSSSSTTIQFFSGMTTFTKSSYPLGRLTLSYSKCENGLQLRCVKD